MVGQGLGTKLVEEEVEKSVALDTPKVHICGVVLPSSQYLSI